MVQSNWILPKYTILKNREIRDLFAYTGSVSPINTYLKVNGKLYEIPPLPGNPSSPYAFPT